MKFLEHRISDQRKLRLLKNWLRAGASEEGEWSKTEEGTPQGAVISKLLANVYLHYVLDLWIGLAEFEMVSSHRLAIAIEPRSEHQGFQPHPSSPAKPPHADLTHFRSGRTQRALNRLASLP